MPADVILYVNGNSKVFCIFASCPGFEPVKSFGNSQTHLQV